MLKAPLDPSSSFDTNQYSDSRTSSVGSIGSDDVVVVMNPNEYTVSGFEKEEASSNDD